MMLNSRRSPSEKVLGTTCMPANIHLRFTVTKMTKIWAEPFVKDAPEANKAFHIFHIFHKYHTFHIYIIYFVFSYFIFVHLLYSHYCTDLYVALCASSSLGSPLSCCVPTRTGTVLPLLNTISIFSSL